MSSNVSSDLVSIKIELPSPKEWSNLKSILQDVWNFLNQPYQEDHFFAFYQLIERAKAGKVKPTFLTKSFQLFYSILGPVGLYFELHRTRIFKAETSSQMQVSECTQLFLSPLLTLHKITSIYLSLLEGTKAVTFDGQLGTIQIPQVSKNPIHYLQDRTLSVYPFISGCPEVPIADQLNRYIQLPLFTQFEAGLLQRGVVIGPGDKVVQENGILFIFDSPTLVNVTLTYGKNSTTPFSFPLNYVYGHLNPSSKDLRSQLVACLIPENRRVQGNCEFIPFPSNVVQQALLEISLLEELGEHCENSDLKGEITQTIQQIEEELIDVYKKEFEEKIRQEQAERQELVKSGAINQIMKNSSSKKSEKKKNREEPSSALTKVSLSEKNSSSPSMAEEILKNAKLKLQVEKKRIKKHKFVSFLSAIKNICTQTEFEGLVSQKGSHLTLHSDEKESLTVVIPHKHDRTVSGKILSRFINKLQGMLKR
jgi:predicted RNA binding protein YcfA (HicA-like mRNA interferase family)